MPLDSLQFVKPFLGEVGLVLNKPVEHFLVDASKYLHILHVLLICHRVIQTGKLLFHFFCCHFFFFLNDTLSTPKHAYFHVFVEISENRRFLFLIFRINTQDSGLSGLWVYIGLEHGGWQRWACAWLQTRLAHSPSPSSSSRTSSLLFPMMPYILLYRVSIAYIISSSQMAK